MLTKHDKSIGFTFLFITIIIALSIFRIWLIKEREIGAITPSPHDMQMYITTAESIVNNEWFGPYNERILARGPMLPLFIAVFYLLHIPLGIAHTTCYVFMSLLFLAVLVKVTNRTFILIPFYILLLFNPFTLDHETSFQITRSTFYPTLILGVITFVLCLVLTVHTSFKKSLFFALFFGCVSFLFWFNREEGFFLLPVIGISYGYSIWHTWKHNIISKQYIGVLSLPIIIFLLLSQVLSFINYTRYGIYTTIQMFDPRYSSAITTLLKIKEPAHNPLIPLSKKTRYLLYSISPSFAKLQPDLEGDLGKSWAYNSKVWTGLPEEELAIAGGSFYFFIREAVWNITQPSPKAEQQFFKQLTKEIQDACSRHYISCSIFPINGFSLLRPYDRQVFLNNLVNTIQTGILVNKLDISTNPTYSNGPIDQINLFRKMTNGIILTSEQEHLQPNRVIKVTYKITKWWYITIMPWIIFLTITLYICRLFRQNFLHFFDWYQASLLISACLFYIVIAGFGTLNSPTNTTAGSYTGAAYVLLIVFSILEMLHIASWKKKKVNKNLKDNISF